MNSLVSQPYDNRIAKLGVYAKGPSLFVLLLFFLLFSGPPSLRVRDPMDSLESVIDLTVLVQSSVWIIAGVWCVWQLRKDLKAPVPIVMEFPSKLGLIMIAFLGVSTFYSDAPMLTAFKVGQMLVCLLFTWIFVYRYGIARVIDYIFIASTVLCIGIAIASFAAPSLVFFSDEGHMRLRGDPIAVMGTVGTYSTILLLTKRSKMPRGLFWSLLAMLGVLLAFSLTRQAWFFVAAYGILYLSRFSKGAVLRALWLTFLLSFPFVFLFGLLPALEEFRATDSIWSLTGRTDLWFYLAQVALTKAAWTGLGYYSASRLLGIDFNPGMGTAHSIFVEVLLGGGLLSLIPCLGLCLWIVRPAIRLLSQNRSEPEFIVGALYLVTLAIALLGGDLASGEIGIAFWSLTAAIPAVSRMASLARAPGRVGSGLIAPRLCSDANTSTT
jgi:hypothetical protein